VDSVEDAADRNDQFYLVDQAGCVSIQPFPFVEGFPDEAELE
jgi:hypothetical protein